MAKHDDTNIPNDMLDDATPPPMGMIDDLNQRLAETEARYKRALADYQNSQRRALENERRAAEAGASGVVERLVPLLDTMRLALDVDPSKVTSVSILTGVRSITDEFTKVLTHLGVQVIDPRENEAFDPMRHQAVMRAEKAGVKPGRIAQTFQIGYALGDRVIRPAKVSVSPSDDAAPAEDSSGCCSDHGCGCEHQSEGFETPGPNDVRVHHHGPKPSGGGCCGGGGGGGCH